jgi:hypothetical protein
MELNLPLLVWSVHEEGEADALMITKTQSEDN